MAYTFVLCADDYGMTPGVSRGVLEAARAGRVNAVSAMTSLPDWPRAAEEWRTAAPRAALGLHVTLTLGRPLGAMPRFAPKDFPPLDTILRAGGALPVGEIRDEITRQVEAFIHHAGRLPDHVDGHQHVHALPGVRTILFDVLRERGCGGCRVRNSSDAPWRILVRRGGASKALAVAAVTRGMGRDARRAGFVCNKGFAGFSPFDPAADMPRQFARFLRAPGPDHLVMCHPGHVDDALIALDPHTDVREAELRFLLSEKFDAVLAQAGAKLAPVKRG